MGENYLGFLLMIKTIKLLMEKTKLLMEILNFN